MLTGLHVLLVFITRKHNNAEIERFASNTRVLGAVCQSRF
jgi:hypothetical protein